MKVDCQQCVMRDIACGECFVSVLLDTSEEVELTAESARAVSALVHAGMVPPLRHRTEQMDRASVIPPISILPIASGQ